MRYTTVKLEVGRSTRTPQRRPSRSVPTLAALLALCLVATNVPSSAGETDGEVQLRSFERAWELINRRYWDPEFGGLDWPAVREELRPAAARATTNAELRDVLGEMISRLGQSHFGVIPAPGDTSSSSDDESASECSAELSQRVQELIASDAPNSGSATAGFDFRFVEGEALVSHVDAGGPAQTLGIEPGWALLSVDGQSVEQIASCLGSGLERRALEGLVYRVVRELLAGESGETVELRLRSPDAELARNVELERTIPADTKSVTFGNLPTVDFRFAADTVPLPESEGEALLIGFNMWMLPVMEPFEQSLIAVTTPKESESVRGVVLDLRGNPGGVAGLSPGIAGYFLEEKESLGTLKYRSDTLHLRINPRLVTRDGQRIETYRGPLVILIDQFSASTSEIFAAGMQDLGRAYVIGERSMGAALPAVIEELPNGDFLMHAMADLERPSGERVEGKGVTPDEVVPRTKTGLRAGRDEPLDAALRWIAEQSSGDATEDGSSDE